MNNLPPGVTDSMIPGNRPEDAIAEDFIEELSALVGRYMEMRHADPRCLQMWAEDYFRDELLA